MCSHGRKNSKKKVIAPLIITYNPGNPPVRTWINEGLEYLHTDHEVKKILPHIDVVFRQDRNVRNRIMKNRYRSYQADNARDDAMDKIKADYRGSQLTT